MRKSRAKVLPLGRALQVMGVHGALWTVGAGGTPPPKGGSSAALPEGDTSTTSSPAGAGVMGPERVRGMERLPKWDFGPWSCPTAVLRLMSPESGLCGHLPSPLDWRNLCPPGSQGAEAVVSVELGTARVWLCTGGGCIRVHWTFGRPICLCHFFMSVVNQAGPLPQQRVQSHPSLLTAGRGVQVGCGL